MTLDEMASELRSKGWAVDPPWTPENCKHENRDTSGSFTTGGRCFIRWSCKRCGKTEEVITDPAPGESYARKNYLPG